MNAHILTIGDEIIIGQTLNTNAAFIGGLLMENEINVTRTSVVGDIEDDILNEFTDALKKNDILIVTGGLGPTHDDITLGAIVKFFNTKLVTNYDVLEDVRQIFLKRNREMTKLNESQALVPEIADVIRNKLGTAPGTWIEKDGKIFVSMPGVPFEMKAMMLDYVLPKLKDKFVPEEVTKRLVLQTTGIPESWLFEKLGDLKELLREAKMAFLPSQFGVKLRITAKGPDEEEVTNSLSEIEQKIRDKVGRYIYAKGEEDLAEIVGRLLTDRGLTLSLAESCTGGNIANRLTNIAGSSKFFERGVVSYSNGSKVEILEVNEDTIASYGAVSEETAIEMAQGIKAISGTDIGLSITGILGPAGGSPSKPVGLVYIGIASDDYITTKKLFLGDNRLINKDRATQAALEVIRRFVLGISLDD